MLSRSLLIIGIIFTVISVIVANEIVGNKHDFIIEYNKKISEKELLIQNLWREKKESEDKWGVSVILYALLKNTGANEDSNKIIFFYLRDALNSLKLVSFTDNSEKHNDDILAKDMLNEYINNAKNTTHIASKQINLIHNHLELRSKEIIEYISELYIEKTEMEREVARIKKLKDHIKSVALLFQLIGLVLVLYFSKTSN